MRADWQNKEVAAAKGRLRLIFKIYQILGRRVCSWFVAIIVLCAYPFLGKVKKASREFFAVLEQYNNEKYHFSTVRHIYTFALSMLDKLGAWSGRIDRSNLVYMNEPESRQFWANLAAGQGMTLICSHLGNIDLLRAMAMDPAQPVPVNAFMDTAQSQVFNEFVAELNPAAAMHLHSSENIGVNTAFELKEKLDNGELLVIAGDRLSARNPQNFLEVTFLGKTVRLPKGAFVLARIFKCPVFFVAIVASGKQRYKVHLKYFTKKEARQSESLALSYARWLESLVEQTPWQWYNFYEYFKQYPQVNIKAE